MDTLTLSYGHDFTSAYMCQNLADCTMCGLLNVSYISTKQLKNKRNINVKHKIKPRQKNQTHKYLLVAPQMAHEALQHLAPTRCHLLLSLFCSHHSTPETQLCFPGTSQSRKGKSSTFLPIHSPVSVPEVLSGAFPAPALATGLSAEELPHPLDHTQQTQGSQSQWGRGGKPILQAPPKCHLLWEASLDHQD